MPTLQAQRYDKKSNYPRKKQRYYPIDKYGMHIQYKGVAFIKRAITDAIYYLTRKIEYIHIVSIDTEIAMPKLQIVDAFSGKIIFECS